MMSPEEQFAEAYKNALSQIENTPDPEGDEAPATDAGGAAGETPPPLTPEQRASERYGVIVDEPARRADGDGITSISVAEIMQASVDPDCRAKLKAAIETRKSGAPVYLDIRGSEAIGGSKYARQAMIDSIAREHDFFILS